MPLTAQQIREFVKSHAVSPDDVRTLAGRATAPHYWASLCPSLSIGGPREKGGQSDSPAIDAALAEYETSGYCDCEGVFDTDTLARLARGIDAVQVAGWPMVFAFVYDEFWNVLHAPALDRFLTTLVGPRYQTTARFWVNHVSAARGAAGFLPHMDGGRGHTVTCWVPLTPASADNGCIYVIERSPASKEVLADFKRVETFDRKQMSLLLAHARALPLAPGGFLAWPQDTVHWGGMFRQGAARLALSWEFMAAEHDNLDAVLPLALLPDTPLPAFEDRLRWACHALLRFVGRDIVMERFAPLARAILEAPRQRARNQP